MAAQSAQHTDRHEVVERDESRRTGTQTHIRGGHALLEDPLFATSHGRALSRDGIARLVTNRAITARQRCPSIAEEGDHPARPPSLDRRETIALGRGRIRDRALAHEKTDTVQIYLHADLALMERALARTTPPHTTPGRYQPPDALMPSGGQGGPSCSTPEKTVPR